MPRFKDEKGVIPQRFEESPPTTRHYPDLGKITIMPSSAKPKESPFFIFATRHNSGGLMHATIWVLTSPL
jgi:hypothetical protein